MRTTLRIVFSFTLLSTLISVGYAQQPRRVLFETFTNSFDDCPLANGLDAAFKQTLSSPNGSELIHLNNHIGNVGDPMVVAGTTANLEMNRLSNGLYPYPIFNGAVDHTPFTSTGLRFTSRYDGTGSTEWSDRISERLADQALVAITLSEAKIDKIGQADSWRLVAKVRVTLQDNNGDSLKLFYAVTQDNVFYEQCQSTKPVTIKNHNNVVRFIDVHGVALDLKGKPQGSFTEVTITHDISKLESHKYKLEDMKLIAFVERGNYDTYEVVQAWELRKNLDTLAAPAAAIAISNVNLEGKSYAPGENIFISFDKTNVDSVKLEFSPDGGGSWQHIENINTNRYFWTAPDVTTTQAQIRVSELKTGTPSATSVQFTIKLPIRGLRILKPEGGDTAFLTKKLIIEWAKIGSEIIEKVDLDYSVNGGATWAILAKNQTGTTFTWNLFGPIPVTEQAMIRITEVTDSVEKVTVSSDAFYIMNPITGGKVESSKIIQGVRLYPQPAESGSMLTIEFALERQNMIEFMLFDMLGKRIYASASHEAAAGPQSHALQLPTVVTGAYILVMRDADGGVINKRIEIR